MHTRNQFAKKVWLPIGRVSLQKAFLDRYLLVDTSKLLMRPLLVESKVLGLIVYVYPIFVKIVI